MQQSFSPSEDFIEMDFDPGSETGSESSGDSGQVRPASIWHQTSFCY